MTQPPGRIRVLLVSRDHEATRDLLRQVPGTDYELEQVSDPGDALALLAARGHDVCLVDVRSAPRDGLDLLDRIREDGIPAPVILLTDQAAPEVDQAASRSGAADYLVKNELSPHLLERSIRYALERSRIQNELSRLARYDGLTGLPNRFLFTDRLQQTMARANRQGSMAAVLFLDLDRFKLVNDSLGHRAGDQLLTAVGQRLRDCVRGSDTVARLGGDEFILILPDLQDSSSAALVARRILVRFARPFQVAQRELYITPSIGIALYPFDGQEVDLLLAGSDAAMYQAKEAGGGCYRFCSSDLNSEAARRLELESALHRALERDEFRLCYQSQVELATGRLVGAEVLLRWQPAGGELLTPGRFLPLLEESGLIWNVGEWVLRTACRQLCSWRAAGTGPPRLALNLSGRQVRNPALPSLVAGILTETGIGAGDLELELLESSLMQNLQEVIEPLRGLQRAGVALVMDDFGTGYSALSCLKHLPLAKIKIDRTFTAQIGRSSADEIIIRTIIAMGHSMGLKVVAEGVETAGQAEFLRREGCDEAQGYLFGRPLAAEAYAAGLEPAAERGEPGPRS